MRIQKQGTLFYAWAAIAMLAVVNVVVFDLTIIAADETLQVQYTPDDAYYYLVLAQNLLRWRTWTFDGGHSSTSGFHPLLAYLLALVYAVARPSSAEFVRYSLALGSIATAAALSIAWGVGLKLRRPSLMIVLAVLLTSGNVVLNSVSGMEWSLVLLLALLYWMQFLPHRAPRTTAWDHALVFTLGLLGSLARSDFGLLAGSLWVACLAVWLKTKSTEIGQTTRHAFWGLVGASVGLLLVLGQNYTITGGFLQSSARMKAYWMEVYGSAHWRAIRTMMGLFNLIPLRSTSAGVRLLLYGLVLVLGLAVAWRAWRKSALVGPRPGEQALVLLGASIVQLVGSVILYSRSGSIPQWYTANAIVPIAILLVAAFRYLDSLLPNRIFAWCASGILLPIVILNVAGLYPIGGDHAPMPHQQIMLRAGRDLAQRELDGRVGSWNAGIISYYQGGTVVNLDGLVNDGIYPWVVRNDLSGYLTEHRIRYVIDFENVFVDPERQRRGGYEGVDLLKRLQPVKVYDQGEYYWKRLTLYRVLSP